MPRRRTGTAGRTKEARQLMRAVRAAGGTVRVTGNNHLRVEGPKGFAFIPQDYGAGGSLKQSVRTIEKEAGLTIEL